MPEPRLTGITVLYDAHCGLCRRAKEWLAEQPAFLQLHFVPAGSSQAQGWFPELEPLQTLRSLTVVGDGGQVYHGDDAWLMCLYALVDYRELALSVAQGPLRRMVFGWGVRLASALRSTSACDGACRV